MGEATREQRLIDAILDIDAHATPMAEDEDGFVAVGYGVSVGSIHRALGVVGHSSVKCRICAKGTPCEEMRATAAEEYVREALTRLCDAAGIPHEGRANFYLVDDLAAVFAKGAEA